MALGTPYRLDLDGDVRDALHAEVCRRVQGAIAGAQGRDDNLQSWRDQLEGFGVDAQNELWANACDLADPISMEAFLTLLSQLCGSMHRDPKVAVEAFSKDDEEGAQIIEQWLSMETSRSSLDRHLYNLAYDACWSPYAVGYAGYEKCERTVRDVGYRKPGDARVLSEEETEEGEDYDEVPVANVVVEERYDIRSVDPADFYLWPPTAESIERATMVCERMSLTEEELWDGVEDFGFSEENVEALCRLGPPQLGDKKEQQADQDGLNEDVSDSGLYEVFTCYTRLPRRLPGGERTPKHLLQDDFLVVCVPDFQIVLKMAFSPFKTERPYFQGGILSRPRKTTGHGLMAMLEPLQSEANANIQLTLDASNLTITPFLVGPKSAQEDVGKWKLQPGGYGAADAHDQVHPLEWDRAPLRDGLAVQQALQARAKALVAAEGQGALQNKVRKNSEVQATETAAGAKFGMYLTNFQRTVVAELYRRLVSLKLQFGDVDDDGEEFLDAEGHSHRLTARALRGKYNIVAAGTSLTHSPEARIQIGQQKQAVQAQYLQAAVAGMPPKFLKLAWHTAREILFDLGDHNPEASLGEEPKDDPPAAGAPVPQQGEPPQPPQAGAQQPIPAGA